MHIENELKKMTSRMFGAGLTDTILEAYRQEQEETGFGEEEAAYQAGKAALAAGLGQAEQEDWKQAEALYTQCLELILRFGFPRGVYGAFQQCFTTEAPRDLFHTLVEQEIRPSGEPWRSFNPEFKEKQSRADHLLEALLSRAPLEQRPHLETTYDIWRQRQSEFFRYAFYLGYRYGLSVVETVAPVGTITSMVDKILLTEHQLSFTFTCAEREREQRAMVIER